MNNNKHILITLCLPFLLFSSPSFTMLAPLFKKIVKWQQEENIKRQQKKRKKIAVIDKKINTIKNEHYKKILNELQRITTRPYDELKKEIDAQRTLAKTLLQKENPHADHDPNIPDVITQQLCKTISQHNSNPNNVDFKYKNSSECTATAYSGKMSAGSFICKPKIVDKPRITAYNPLLKQSQALLEQICGHEWGHVVLQHSYILSLASNELPNIITKEGDTESYTAPEIYYKKKGISCLASLIEEEADINASLTNSQIAYTGMQARCSFWPHSHITDKQNHCEQLKTIYQLMVQQERLTTSES